MCAHSPDKMDTRDARDRPSGPSLHPDTDAFRARTHVHIHVDVDVVYSHTKEATVCKRDAPNVPNRQASEIVYTDTVRPHRPGRGARPPRYQEEPTLFSPAIDTIALHEQYRRRRQ